MNKLAQHGVSLIELMISMVIGLFLLSAVGAVYISSKDTLRTSDNVSRMQENARFALHLITEDLQMAGFLGNSINPALVEGRAGATGQLDALTGTIADCVTRWYIDTSSTLVVGNNDEPVLDGTDFAATCLRDQNVLATTDVIAVKRAGTAHIDNPMDAMHTNWMLIRTDAMRGQFYVGGGTPPPGFTASPLTDRRWLAHVYFIAPNTDTGIPGLNRLVLGSGPSIRDQGELISGIQDVQIQYGIDTDDDGGVNQFVEPNAAGSNPVVAARVWILARSELPETGHDDSSNTYVYANKRYIPSDDSTDNGTETDTNPTQFRRLLLSSTVALRNP